MKLFSGKFRHYSHLQVFESFCYGQSHPRSKDKFVGYPYGKKGWPVYDLESGENFVSRDVVFYENKFPFAANGNWEHLGSTKAMIGSLILRMTEDNRVKEMGLTQISQVEDARNVEEQTTSNGRNNMLGQNGPTNEAESGPELNENGADHDRISQAISHQNESAREDASQTIVQRKSDRERHLPSRLADYICHTVKCPLIPSSSPLRSSGIRYPIEQLISYKGASNCDISYLAAIDSKVEP